MVRTLTDALSNNNNNTTVTTKKNDLPNRKRAKKTPTEGKVSKKTSTSPDKQKKKKEKKVASNGAIVVHKKPHRFRPGKLAEIEIRRFQRPNSPELLIPKIAVFRLVKEIMGQIGDFRLSREAFYALRLAVEGEAVSTLASANRMAIHASRVTIMPSDFDAVTDVRQFFPDPAMKDKKPNARYLEARETRLKKAMIASRAKPLTLKGRVTELSTNDEEASAVDNNPNPTGYD